MRCPKCGAFLDEGRRECFMCGATIEYETDEKTRKNANNSKRDNTKKSGILKVLVTIVLIVVIALLIIYVVLPLLKNENENVFGKLNYKMSENFELNKESESSMLYLKDKNCSIEFVMGDNGDEEYVTTYFSQVLTDLVNNGTSLEDLISNDYETKEGKLTINGTSWSYLNVLYKSETGSYNLLKYRYLTTVFDGKFYNVKLVNMNNESQCALELDNLVNSFEFKE